LTDAQWLAQAVRLEVERPRASDELINLVANPSGDLGAWGWSTPVAGSALRSVEASGARSLRYTSPGAVASWFVTEAFKVAASRHVAAGWVAAQVTGRYTVRVEWINAAGDVFSSSATSAQMAASTSRQVYGTVQAPSGTTHARLRFDHLSTTGGIPPANSTMTLREVTVADAASATNLRTVRTNLMPNPSGETNATGWSANPGATVTSSTAQAVVGTRSLLFERGAKGNLAASSPAVAVQPGRDYTLSCRVRARSNLRTVTLYARFLNPSGVQAVSDVKLASSFQETSGSWSTVRGGRVTAPASGVASMQLILVWGSCAAGEGHYVDAVLVEESGAVGTYFDGSTTAAGGVTYAWTGAAHASASTATTGTGVLPALSPILWQNILGPATGLSTTRGDLELGTMEVTLRDPTLDPATSPLIRAGRRARLVTAAGESLFSGQIVPDSIDVAYEPLVRQEDKRTVITFSVTDAQTALASNTRPEGVATIPELPHVLEGCGVPWSVNGSGDQVPSATVVAFNSSSTALDQVVITRDTARGFAWVDRNGVVQVWDRHLVPSDQRAFLDESVYGPNFASGFDPNSCVNIVEVVVLAIVATTGAVEEVRYGPYRDEASIERNGDRPGTYTVQGSGWNAGSVAAYAQAILTANADPRRRVREVTVAITEDARLSLALLDLQDRVRVQNTRADISEISRVTSVRHVLTPGRGWLMTLTFAGESVAAAPVAVTPPPPAVRAVKTDVDDQVAEVETIATDAASTASAAQTAASNAATAAGNAQSTADNAATAASNAAAAASDAATAAANAQQAAAAKSKVTFSASTPGSTPNTAGDVWFQTASGVVLSQWQGNGGTSWTERKVSGTALAADAIDGRVITGATLRTAATGERVVVRNDGGGGIIESFSGLSGETPTTFDPTAYSGVLPALRIANGTAGTYSQASSIRMNSGTPGVPFDSQHTAEVSAESNSIRLAATDRVALSGKTVVVTATDGGTTIVGGLAATMGNGSVGTGTFASSVDSRVDARVAAGAGAPGYANLALVAGVTGSVQYRQFGPLVHVEGAVTFASLANNTTRTLCAAGAIPAAARPIQSLNLAQARLNGGTTEAGIVLRGADGSISVTNKSGAAVTTAQFAYSYLVA
jgi:hypothetical protein